MRGALSCAAACLALGATALPAQAGPDVGAMRVVISESGVAGILRGECHSSPVPNTDPGQMDHLVVVAAVTTYATPPLGGVCWIQDVRTHEQFGSVPLTSAGQAGAGAGIVPVPVDAFAELCFRLDAGGQMENPPCRSSFGALRTGG